MVWHVRTSYENKFRPEMESHPDDLAKYRSIQKSYKKDHGISGEVSLRTGFLLQAPQKPYRFQVTSEHKSLPNFLSARIGKAVPQRVIDVIEEFEPSVHRYWPTEITFKEGSKSEPYWLLNITQQLDTICRERSTVKEISMGTRKPMVLIREDIPPDKRKVSCLKKFIGAHHLWCEYYFDNHEMFISDALAEAFREIGAEGLKFKFHAEEI